MKPIVTVLALLISVSVTACGGAAVGSSGGGSDRSPPVPTQDIHGLGEDYLVAVAPLNAATAALDSALTTAMTTPCTCAPGSFDARPVLARLPAVVSEYKNFGLALTVIKNRAPPSVARDIDVVLPQLIITENDLEGVMHAPEGQAGSLLAQADSDAEALTAPIRHVRADLQL